MSVDTKKLRELAEKSIESKPTGTGCEWRVHYDYEKAANPETVIALLDRIENLEKVFNFVKDAQCECSISERLSGHVLGCWKPEFEELTEEVTHE